MKKFVAFDGDTSPCTVEWVSDEDVDGYPTLAEAQAEADRLNALLEGAEAQAAELAQARASLSGMDPVNVDSSIEQSYEEGWTDSKAESHAIIAELEAKVTRLREDADRVRSLNVSAAEVGIDLVAQNRRLREALRRYADHDEDCDQIFYTHRACTCGYREALAQEVEK